MIIIGLNFSAKIQIHIAINLKIIYNTQRNLKRKEGSLR